MDKKAILLVNLGTPAELTRKAVKTYLKEFLLDPFVIDLPWVFRQLLVRGIIVPFRSKKSLHAYEQIWAAEGSPLLLNSQRLAKSLGEEVSEDIFLAMRYGEPSIKSVISKMQDYTDIDVVPLYPQYALSTTETVKDELLKWLPKSVKVEYLKYFFNLPEYIKSVAESVKPFIGKYDHILFSYHGLPNNHITKHDDSRKCLVEKDCCAHPEQRLDFCYRAQCVQATELVAEQLQLKDYSYSFQSRIGKNWLRPFTEDAYKELAEAGVKKLAVVCPAFTVDCLETLEEIGMRGREDFLNSGGEDFTQIPCLNANKTWVKALAGIIQNKSGNWLRL